MKKQRPSRVVFDNSTSIEMHIVHGLREPWTRINGKIITLEFYSGLNVFYAKGMALEKVREICR